MSGIKLQCLLVVLTSLLEHLEAHAIFLGQGLFPQSDAQIVVWIGKTRVDAQRLPIARNRLGEFSLVLQRVA